MIDKDGNGVSIHPKTFEEQHIMPGIDVKPDPIVSLLFAPRM